MKTLLGNPLTQNLIFVLVLLVITSSSRNELKIAQSNYECE